MKVKELPDWDYGIEEVSSGVYQLKATDKQGRGMDLTGVDPEKLVIEFSKTAKRWTRDKVATAATP